MKTKVLFFIWVVCVGVLAWLAFDSGREEAWIRKPIYDESADASKQIADALTLAKREHKQVLLQFGANWCVWCHRLHHFCETNKAVNRKLRSDFVIVFAMWLTLLRMGAKVAACNECACRLVS